ncbi:MAG: hypothetical protein JNM56_37620, partial [Planctomycetia bacterium]|nr:hypothetical protein [Planctomycetia bacterium]
RALVGKVTNRPAEIAPGQSDAQAATSQKRQKAQSDQAPPSTRGRKTDPDSQQRNEICYRVYEVERLKKAIGLQEVRTRLEKIGLGDLAPKHWSHLRGYAKLWAEKNEKSFTRPSQEKARKPQ